MSLIVVGLGLGCGPADPVVVVDRGDERLRLRELAPIHADGDTLYFTARAYSSDKQPSRAGVYRVAIDGTEPAEQVLELPGMVNGVWNGGEILAASRGQTSSTLVTVREDGTITSTEELAGVRVVALTTLDGYVIVLGLDGVLTRIGGGEPALTLGDTGNSPDRSGDSQLLAAGGNVYWTKGAETVARIAIDGSESAPTILSSDYFGDYGDYPFEVRTRLLGVVDGELLVATSVYEDAYNDPGCDCPFGITHGGIHTVSPPGESPRLLTDELVLAARRADSVYGITTGGDGAELGLSGGGLRRIDQAVGDLFFVHRLLATDDALYYVRDHPGYVWNRIEMLHFGG